MAVFVAAAAAAAAVDVVRRLQDQNQEVANMTNTWWLNILKEHGLNKNNIFQFS